MAKRKAQAPPTVRLLQPADYRRMKWKNGKGETLEIAVDDHDPFRWRVSKAAMPESAHFSLYTGYDRQIMFLGEGRVHLHGGDIDREVQPEEVVSFSGDVELAADIESENEDFNVFTLRGATRSTLHVAEYRGIEEVQLPFQGNEHFLHAFAGEIEYLEPNTDTRGIIPAGSTLWVTRPKEVNLLNLRTKAKTRSARAAWAIVSQTN